MKNQTAIRKPIDLNEWAYSTIKLRILNDEIKSGEQLKVDEIANELEVSRTPVREALLCLERDGLVTTEPRVGFFVRGITREELDDLFELRMLIEGYAAEKVVEIISDKEIENLVKIHRQSIQMAEKGKLYEFNQLEVQFHNKIISNLKNKKIIGVLNGVGDLLYRERMYALKIPENVSLSLSEHDLIVNAIQARNSLLSRQKMEYHIRCVKERLQKMSREF